jgi:hypothetical protein
MEECNFVTEWELQFLVKRSAAQLPYRPISSEMSLSCNTFASNSRSATCSCSLVARVGHTSLP